MLELPARGGIGDGKPPGTLLEVPELRDPLAQAVAGADYAGVDPDEVAQLVDELLRVPFVARSDRESVAGVTRTSWKPPTGEVRKIALPRPGVNKPLADVPIHPPE